MFAPVKLFRPNPEAEVDAEEKKSFFNTLKVIPMVNGHDIHKPKVRITRLNLEDLNLLTRPQRPNNERTEQDEEGDAQNENPSEVGGSFF
jgi:hypothetical protein